MAPNTTVGQQELPCYTRENVCGHRKLDDCWIILHGAVYDVTSWLKRHPGGARLIMHYAGEDASVSADIAMIRGFSLYYILVDFYKNG